MTRDARLSALHRGGFGLPGPRFRLLGRPPSYNGGQLPCGSVQRAPRTQVVVPGGGGPCLPARTVTSRRRRTPRLAPHSGSSLEHALNERGWASSSIGTIRSQDRSCDVVRKISPGPVMAGLDPAIHLLRKKVLAKNDGPAGQAPGRRMWHPPRWPCWRRTQRRLARCDVAGPTGPRPMLKAPMLLAAVLGGWVAPSPRPPPPPPRHYRHRRPHPSPPRPLPPRAPPPHPATQP